MDSKQNVKDESKKLMIITIVTVMILVIIFAGVTYAFFSANNPEGSTAEIKSETGRMLITYNDGTDNIVPVTNIQPSNKILVNKTFTLTGSNTTVGMSEGDGLPMPYKVGVKYTSTFSDGMMHYYIKEINRANTSNVTVNYTGEVNQTVPGNDTYTGYTHGTFKNGKKYTEMVTGVFPALKTDQTITFNLIIQFPDNNENQDSEKGKTFNGKVVVNYEPSFANDSWDEIAAIVKENPKSYAVGSTKTLKVYDNPNGETTNGTYKEYTVRVANNTTPEECKRTDFSQTACGFVVEFADIVENKQMNSSNTNVGGWEKTAMRTYANGDFYNSLPEELRNAIKSTKVVSGHGSTTGETNFTTTDNIYLLSAHEVWKNNFGRDTAYDQTRQLDYYAENGVTTSKYSGAIKKNINGNASSWWLRAASSYSYNPFLYVTDDGNWYVDDANNSYGFAPAFRIG